MQGPEQRKRQKARQEGEADGPTDEELRALAEQALVGQDNLSTRARAFKSELEQLAEDQKRKAEKLSWTCRVLFAGARAPLPQEGYGLHRSTADVSL